MPRKRVTGKILAPPDKGVIVRMYSTGFGDCFLLAFRGRDGNARYVLIDCGVHHQYPDHSKRIERVARDIGAATGNRLHVVAVTHEHTDHLYGFKYAEDLFKEMTIDQLWLAWTEDPDNAVANELKRLKGRKIKALSAVVDRLKALNSPMAARLEGILHFDLGADGGGLKGTADVLEALRKWSKKKLDSSEDYLKPGQTLKMPDVEGVKCYVLGPPENVESIEKLEEKEEMYAPLAALDEETAFIAAVTAASGRSTPEEDQLFRLSTPFDNYLEMPEAAAADSGEFGTFFREHYGFDNKEQSGPGWRRIDTDWLAAADRLALSINDYTNNTSLVLAFELPGKAPRKVLLFTGDAQMGNWLSWQDVKWSGEKAGDEELTAAELLRRTVLYKVGHHGSKNATARHKGLEMMESPDLTAMLPVDEEWARSKQGWNHPEKAIVDRLEQKARGRILRSDKIPKGESLDKSGQASDKEWKAFVKNVEWDKSEGPVPLWIQYTVE